MRILDNKLRLLVGADPGNGSTYGSAEVDITPGLKRVRVYNTESVCIVTIKDN